MMMFRDRTEAGNLLAQKLQHLKADSVVVVAIPRGGLPIGAVLAKALIAPLDVALTKKIGHPHNREFAIGAISLDHIILDQPQEISRDYIASETNRLRLELKEKYTLFYRNKQPCIWKNKTVVITDDGLATGYTLRAALALIHAKKPKGIVIALPVAPAAIINEFEKLPGVQEVVCLQTPHYFDAVGAFYEDFRPINDEKAVEIFESN